MNRDQLLDLLEKHDACEDATEWVRASDKQTAREIWESCESGDWMLWIAARLEIDRKLIVTAACLCARQSLVHVQPGEDRPRIAIETTEKWVRGEATIEEVRATKNAAAYAADAASSAADYASSAASYAAVVAYASSSADAAAYAAYAASSADARRKSLSESARLVRTVIAWDAIEAKIGGAK